MTIKKTNKYLVGTSSATAILGKELKLKFDEGEFIEVTTEQGETMINLGWGEEVKDGE
jgi:hypothetical protein